MLTLPTCPCISIEHLLVLGAFIDGVMEPPTKLPPKDRYDGLQVWCRVCFLAYLRDRRDRLRASPARP
ncbi:MAG: hypothetical protein IH888_10630 [Planctomycetes bacterium]|nr:hypothetical protein [Planctomycetota bacterium]